MSAIAPPPVGAEAEPSVVSDNASALVALRASLRKSRFAARTGHAKLRRLPPSLAVLFAFGAGETIWSGGSRDYVKARGKPRIRR
jgi:hypothetical protein